MPALIQDFIKPLLLRGRTRVFNDTNLEYREFRCLEPNRRNESEITAGVIDAFLHLISKQHDDVRCIRLHDIQYFRDEMARTKKIPQLISDFEWPREDQKLRYVFAPLSLGGHWGLAVFDLEKKELRVMDSMNKHDFGTAIEDHGKDILYVFKHIYCLIFYYEILEKCWR